MFKDFLPLDVRDFLSRGLFKFTLFQTYDRPHVKRKGQKHTTMEGRKESKYCDRSEWDKTKRCSARLKS